MFCNRDSKTLHVSVGTENNRPLVDKLRKKFIDEAKAIFEMNHPNIVKVYDIFEENGTAYYVMDYIDGQSLGDLVKLRGALPEAEAVGYICQVAEALKYVHAQNRLHLDIKPGNIIVDDNGHAMLIDFGASKHYDTESGENTSNLLGVNTKGYAPLEQSTQSFTKFSPATDIYALGATLYKLLTGVTPPDANLLVSGDETLLQVPDSISATTRKAVSSAMEPKRANRPQDIDAFLKILNPKPVAERNKAKPHSVEQKATSTPKKNSSKVWKSLLHGLLFLIVIGGYKACKHYKVMPSIPGINKTTPIRKLPDNILDKKKYPSIINGNSIKKTTQPKPIPSNALPDSAKRIDNG